MGSGETARPADDAALIARVRSGDPEAMTAIYDRYAGRVYAAALRVAGETTRAEDVLQEVFLQLWRNPAAIDGARGRHAAWLAAVARDRAADSQQRAAETADLAAFELPPDAEEPPAAGAAPPQRARERFLAALGREPHPRTVRMRRPFWEVVPILAAAVVVLIAILLWRENVQLRRRLEYARGSLTVIQQQLAINQDVAAAGDSSRFSLAAPGSDRGARGDVVVTPDGKRLFFAAWDLAPLPPGKTYQLWLLPSDGVPIPAGTFLPQAEGVAALHAADLPAARPRGFAVSIEPEGGSAKPTTPMYMVMLGQ